jgi:hypothetical protein
MAGIPHPPYFGESAESYEKKRVEFCVSARKYKKAQKSARRKEIDQNVWAYWQV